MESTNTKAKLYPHEWAVPKYQSDISVYDKSDVVLGTFGMCKQSYLYYKATAEEVIDLDQSFKWTDSVLVEIGLVDVPLLVKADFVNVSIRVPIEGLTSQLIERLKHLTIDTLYLYGCDKRSVSNMGKIRSHLNVRCVDISNMYPYKNYYKQLIARISQATDPTELRITSKSISSYRKMIESMSRISILRLHLTTSRGLDRLLMCSVETLYLNIKSRFLERFYELPEVFPGLEKLVLGRIVKVRIALDTADLCKLQYLHASGYGSINLNSKLKLLSYSLENKPTALSVSVDPCMVKAFDEDIVYSFLFRE